MEIDRRRDEAKIKQYQTTWVGFKNGFEKAVARQGVDRRDFDGRVIIRVFSEEDPTIFNELMAEVGYIQKGSSPSCEVFFVYLSQVEKPVAEASAELRGSRLEKARYHILKKRSDVFGVTVDELDKIVYEIGGLLENPNEYSRPLKVHL